MGFKSDREFLRNVSIGAIATRQVASALLQGGFRIIELERQSCSNKIWPSKIKRLRVPDLLCLRSGIRIESRGKSNLEVTMSHAINKPERAWDSGLRDNDLVAFVKCWPCDDSWTASSRSALFRAGDMRRTAGEAGLSRMKSAAEGSEIRLTWPTVVPNRSGIVTGVSPEKIETLLGNGRKQQYRLARKNKSLLIAHVTIGDEFGDGDRIIASALPAIIPPFAQTGLQYDFLADLGSASHADAYVAVKALGHLSEAAAKSVPMLVNLSRNHADSRIRLEAAASLARLGEDGGWNAMEELLFSTEAELAYRMETALILAEIRCQRASMLLERIATSQAANPELRSAAVWGLAPICEDISTLLQLTADADESTAAHAIVGVSRRITNATVARTLEVVGTDVFGDNYFSALATISPS